MSRGVRTTIFLALVVLPVVVSVAAAVWAFWRTGILWWTWWVLPVSWGLAWLLIRREGRGPRSSAGSARAKADERAAVPPHWSPRDRAAMELVEAAAAEIDGEEAARRLEPAAALDAARDLAERLARHYHPGVAEPLDRVTVVELVAAANLALDDLERRVNDVVPGSHLITIGQWRMLARSPRLVRAASGVGWLASSLANPANLARWASARGTVDPLARQVRSNVLVHFQRFMVRRLGEHLVEMHSGRLRGGSDAYRTRMRTGAKPGPDAGTLPSHASGAAGAADERARRDAPDVADAVRIAVIGQQGSGVSSLVAALLGRPGEPEAAGPGRHRLRGGGDDAPRLELEELPGHGGDADASSRAAILKAAAEADLVLLVMDVRRPARGPDLAVVQDIHAACGSARGGPCPPIVGVLTHVDQLSPVREWTPPYDWSAPGSPKERSIAEAVAAVSQDLGESVDAVVPACTGPAADRVHGVDEWLAPVMASLLDRAHAAAMVRSLDAHLDRERVGRVAGQMASAGRALIAAAIDGRRGGTSARTAGEDTP